MEAKDIIHSLLEAAAPDWFDTLIKAEADGAGIHINFNDEYAEVYYDGYGGPNIAEENELLSSHLHKLLKGVMAMVEEDYTSTVGRMSDDSYDWDELEGNPDERFSRSGRYLGYDERDKNGKLAGLPFAKLSDEVKRVAMEAYADTGIPQERFDTALEGFKSTWDDNLSQYGISVDIIDNIVRLTGSVSDVEDFLKELKSYWPGGLGEVIAYDPFDL